MLIGLTCNFITDLTDIIQQLPVLGNYEITAYTVKAEEKGDRSSLLVEMPFMLE